jgi:hypothetical protein
MDTTAAMDAWNMCLSEAAKTFAKASNEPAETVAAGAFGYCEKDEHMYRASLAEKLGNDDATLNRIIDVFKYRHHDGLIALILSTRSEKNR